jgi:uncharacterized protein YukE
MPDMIGMDPAAARALASQLEASASRMEQTVNRLVSRLDHTGWVGHDRDAFESALRNTHRLRVMTTVRAMREAAAQVRRHAADQVRISGR